MTIAQMLADVRQRPLAAGTMVTYLLCVCLLTFQPGGGAAGRGVILLVDVLNWFHFPATIANTGRAEVLLNILMLMPLPIVGMWMWPRTNWRDWTAFAFLASLTIETIQIPMPTRDASASDVASNAGGALIGGLLLIAARWLLESHRLHQRFAQEQSATPPPAPSDPLRKAQ